MEDPPRHNDEAKRDPTPRSSSPKVIDVVSGVSDTLFYASRLLRGHKIAGKALAHEHGGAPVVLVHGFLGTRATMEPLTRRFQKDGRPVFSYAYGTFNTAAIQESSRGLLRHLEIISQEYGSERVDVVGFSMGGLLSLYALKMLGGAKYVRSLAMLGTPLRGSWLSLAGALTIGAMSPSAWQLLPPAKILETIRETPLPSGVRLAQFHATGDLFCPNPGRLPEVSAEDYLIAKGGHSSLIVAPHFYDGLRQFHDRVEIEPEINAAANLETQGPKVSSLVLAAE